MFTWKILNRLYKLLSGEISPKQIAGGIAFGMIVGLTPTCSLHNLLVILLICIIRVNVSAFIFSAVVFGLLSFLIDPAAHLLGYLLLVQMEFRAVGQCNHLAHPVLSVPGILAKRRHLLSGSVDTQTGEHQIRQRRKGQPAL